MAIFGFFALPENEKIEINITALSVKLLIPCFLLQNLTNIPHEKLENYFLILSAIEQNLAEAKKIQEEIVEVRSEP